MTTEPKVADLPGKLRARAARLHGQTAGADLVADELEECAKDIEAALSRQDAQPEDWGPSHKQPWHEAEDAQPEQQGAVDVDGLARIIREVDGAHSLGASALAEAILSRVPSIAARQPVGQEPVCSISPYDLGKLQKHEIARVHPPGQGVPLYTAPPAQVDLAQFRESVIAEYDGAAAIVSEFPDFSGVEERTREERLAIPRAKRDRLLAIIDQQAGGAK